MKGYISFTDGFLGAEKIATNPISEMKYLDWEKALKIIAKNPNSTIMAGLKEDWEWTSGIIYDNGKYLNNYVYGASSWATPILDVDGKEIECWSHENPKYGADLPSWWCKKNKPIIIGECSEYDMKDSEE